MFSIGVHLRSSAARLLILACAGTLSAQVLGIVEGIITGPDGKPIGGAVVGFDRVELTSRSDTKTDKKGYYSFSTLQAGTYNVTVTVDGKLRARRVLYRVTAGRQDTSDFANGNTSNGLVFKLNPPDGPVVEFRSQFQGAMEMTDSGKGKAPAAGQLDLSATNKAAADKNAEARAASAAEREQLTAAFNAGKAAIAAKQYDEAIADFTKASDLDPKQSAVWSSLADVYMIRSLQRGVDKESDQSKAAEAFQKTIALSPASASYYNNYALSLARASRLPEARTYLAKAIELDPGGAGTYHYNLGALLLNANQNDAAIEELLKAIAADPAHASYHFQLGMARAGKATADAGGKLIPPAGTVEELQKYLELDPTGPNSQSAKDMIRALGGTIPAAPASKNK